jgi:hypothetical protein
MLAWASQREGREPPSSAHAVSVTPRLAASESGPERRRALV